MCVGDQMVEVTNVCKSYGRKNILKGVSFTASPGQQIALVGRNGCGKSTLMQIMAGLLKPIPVMLRISERNSARVRHSHIP